MCSGTPYAPERWPVARLVPAFRLSRVPGSQLLCGFLLPTVPLLSDFSELNHAGLGGDAAERRSRLDGLQLLGIADENNFRAGLFGALDQMTGSCSTWRRAR